MVTREKVIFYLNGTRHEVGPDRAGWMLADYLRYDRRLTGTKIVCAEGDCGACSVLRRFSISGRKAPYLPINACITTVAQMDGSSLVSVDALGGNPVQQAMVSFHGSQCGYCTPGFVMALTGLVEKKLCSKEPGPIQSKEAKNSMTGNLCRCTGYQPIIDAAVSIDLSKCASVRERFSSSAQERDLKKIIEIPVHFTNDRFSFFAPRSLKAATQYLTQNKAARLVAAATDLGVAHNKEKIRLEQLLSLHLVPQLYEYKKKITHGTTFVRVGARVTLSDLRQLLKKDAPEIARFLDLFASPQIKNVATLVGNVGNASPIADTPPFLLATNAQVEIIGARGRRTIPLDEFYLGYRKTALKVGEIIGSIEFSLPKKSDSFALYKVSQRKDLDISGVNAAFNIRWSDSKRSKIAEVRIAMGGVAATPLRLKKTEKFLKGRDLSEETLARAVQILHSEMNPLSDLRGTTAFRRVLVENIFDRFFRENAFRVERSCPLLIGQTP